MPWAGSVGLTALACPTPGWSRLTPLEGMEWQRDLRRGGPGISPLPGPDQRRRLRAGRVGRSPSAAETGSGWSKPTPKGRQQWSRAYAQSYVCWPTWESPTGWTDPAGARAIRQTEDQGFIIAGWTGAIAGARDILAIKTASHRRLACSAGRPSGDLAQHRRRPASPRPWRGSVQPRFLFSGVSVAVLAQRADCRPRQSSASGGRWPALSRCLV